MYEPLFVSVTEHVTVNTLYDVRRVKKDGTYPVYIRVCCRHDKLYLPTGISLSPEDYAKALIVKTGSTKICKAKAQIGQCFKKVNDAVDALNAENNFTFENLKEILGRIDFASQTLIILVNKVDKAENVVFNKNVTIINNIVSSADYKADILPIAAKSGVGLDSLRKMLSDKKKSQIESADSTLITNVRHLEALREAHTSLLRVRESLDAGIPSDLVAQDLREAIATLNSILGRHIDSTTILNHIFKNHCIGK